jgi:hypothetical protein
MSLVRLGNRSILTRASARASGAGAGVNSTAKCNVPTCVWACRIERRGIVELPRIAIRRPVEHDHRSAGRDVDSTHSDRTARQPEVAFDRTLDPERLLDEVGDPVGFAPQQLLDVPAQHLGLPALARRLGGERIVPLTPVD